MLYQSQRAYLAFVSPGSIHMEKGLVIFTVLGRIL